MSITKEVLDVEENLDNKIKNNLLFLGIKVDIYIITLAHFISITKLETYIKTHKNATIKEN